MPGRSSGPQATASEPTDGARRESWWTGCWRASASKRPSAVRSNNCGATARLPGGATMRVAIVNIGTIVTGDLTEPLAKGDTIVTDGDRIVTVGTASASEV